MHFKFDYNIKGNLVSKTLLALVMILSDGKSFINIIVMENFGILKV